VGGVEDPEVVAAFVGDGSGAVLGQSLNVENRTLKLDAWWAVAYRVSGRTFIVRDEEAPTDSTAVSDVAAALTARGLAPVGADLPAISLLTYTILDLGYAPWVLWSTDRATGEAELNAKATKDTFLEAGPAAGPAATPDSADHVRAARRMAGVDATDDPPVPPQT